MDQKTNLQNFHVSNFQLICSFLNQSETIKMSHICRKFYYIIRQEGFWTTLSLSNYDQDFNFQKRWIQQNIKNITPSKLDIFLENNGCLNIGNFLNLFKQKLDFITDLSIDLKHFQITQQYLITCRIFSSTNLKSLETSILIQQPQIYNSLKNLQHIFIVGQYQLYSGDLICHLPNLSSLVLKSHELNFQELNKFIKRSSQKLQWIEVDCENYPVELLSSMICQLKPYVLKRLLLYHLQNIPQYCFLHLAKVESLLQLVLTKTYEISNKSFQILFDSTKWPYLQTLDISQAINIEDNSFLKIIKKSKALKTVKIAWCTKLTPFSIDFLIKNCLQIEHLILTGVKLLNDSGFSEIQKISKYYIPQKYVETKKNIKKLKNNIIDKQRFFKVPINFDQINCLKKLKELDCVSCDYLNTIILQIISLCRPGARILDYYSNQIGIFEDLEME